MAAQENAGTAIPEPNQLSGAVPSIQLSPNGSVPTDEIPSMSPMVSPASAIAALVAWIVSSSGESPVLRPTVE